MIDYVFSVIEPNPLAFIMGIVCGMLFELMIVFITKWIDGGAK